MSLVTWRLPSLSCLGGCHPSRHLEGANLLVPTSEQIDVIVPTSSATQNHAMRMECGSRDGCALVSLEEARVGLDPGELMAVKIKDLDEMRRSSTVVVTYVSY